LTTSDYYSKGIWRAYQDVVEALKDLSELVQARIHPFSYHDALLLATGGDVNVGFNEVLEVRQGHGINLASIIQRAQ
jgi:hypothetical protein